MKTKRIALVLIILFIVGTLVYLGVKHQRPTGSAKNEFKIGVLSWVGFGPFFVAEEKGLFEKEGLDVEIHKIEEAAPLREALISRRVHGIIGTIDSFATGLAAGLPAKVILKVDESCGSDGIVANKDIKTLKDLKGKRVAFPKGIPSHFFLLYLLKEAGLSPNDIVPEYMEAGNASAAFIARKVDAAVTWEPWLSKAADMEHGHIIATSKDHPGLIVDLFAVHEDVLKTRLEDVRRLQRGWFAALEFIKRNPSEAHSIIGKAMGIESGEVGAMLSGLKFASYEENLEYFGAVPGKQARFPGIFESAGKIWKTVGLVDSPAKGTGSYDVSPLRDLYR